MFDMIIQEKGQAKEKVLLPNGDYDAAVSGIIELGAHAKMFQGEQQSPKPVVKIVFEVSAEGHDETLVFSKDVNAVFNERSNLVKYLSAIYGTSDPKVVKSNLEEKGALEKLLGRHVVLTIDTFNVEGRTVNYIKDIKAMDKRLLAGAFKPTKETILFTIHGEDAAEVFKTKLSKYTQEKIVSATNVNTFPKSLIDAFTMTAEDKAKKVLG
jgi:hypothetical protein